MIVVVRIEVPEGWPSEEWFTALKALAESGHHVKSVLQEKESTA